MVGSNVNLWYQKQLKDFLYQLVIDREITNPFRFLITRYKFVAVIFPWSLRNIEMYERSEQDNRRWIFRWMVKMSMFETDWNRIGMRHFWRHRDCRASFIAPLSHTSSLSFTHARLACTISPTDLVNNTISYIATVDID